MTETPHTPAAPAAPTFDPDVVAAVARHMNEDHAEDTLRIVRALGGRPDATAASMAGLDGAGADFDVEGPDGTARIRIPWSTTLTERGQIRVEVVRMHDEACRILGIDPPAGEH